MPDITDQLRRRYAYYSKDLLGPAISMLTAGREVCGGDLDKLLIALAIAIRTAEHRDTAELDINAVLSGELETYPSLMTNVRSIAESTGIPKETVRRKVAALVADGWVVRSDHSLGLAPYASRQLTDFREQMLAAAVRYEQIVLEARRELDATSLDR